MTRKLRVQYANWGGTVGGGDDVSLFFSQYLTSFANETYSINVRNTGVSTRGGCTTQWRGL